MERKTLIYSLCGVIIILMVTIGCIISFNAGKKHSCKIAVDFTVTEESEGIIGHWEYQFLNKDLSDYICNMCESLGIDSDRAVAQLMVDNPDFDPAAMHRNENGTVDVGLFQSNDRYLWTTFKERYWLFENVELDPFNWKHSVYIALHHMKYLDEKFKIEDDSIMAYNCGEGAVMNGSIPDATKVYLKKVKLNMQLLKKED